MSRRDAIEYLVVGHVTQDITPEGPIPGGTVAYASLTARALGARVGIVTSYADGAVLGPVADLPLAVVDTAVTTVFENTYGPEGRTQRLVSVAAPLDRDAIPEDWLGSTVLHLGPVADEVDARIAFMPWSERTFIGATPQGWMRRRDGEGRVRRQPWSGYRALRRVIDAVILSDEDVGGDESIIEELADTFDVLVVTRGYRGARLFLRGRAERVFDVSSRTERDPTGAGDVFASTFFWLMAKGKEPSEAVSMACDLAGESVERDGLAGIPTSERVSELR